MAPPASRTALVTGANKGIGLAIVRNLALQYPSSALSQNGTVPLLIYLTARDQARGEAALASLQNDASLKKAKALARDGGLSTIKYRPLDISKEESIQAMSDFLSSSSEAEGGGTLDVVVNNAGIALQGFDADVVRTTLHTNYTNTTLAVRKFIPLLRRSRSGGHARLVNVTSMSGELNSKYSSAIASKFRATKSVADVDSLIANFQTAVERGTHKEEGWPSAAYAVSKSGVTAMTRAIAKEEKEAGSGVLVNCCCPGWVKTDMTKGSGYKSVDHGAMTPVMLALGEIRGVEGEYWQHEKVKRW